MLTITKIQRISAVLTFIICSINLNAQVLEWAANHVEGVENSGSVNNYSTAEESIKDNDGNIISVGRFLGEIDMNSGEGVDLHISRHPETISTTYNQCGFIKKIDSQGNYIWTKSILATGSLNVEDVAVDTDGNYYLIGSFSGAVYKDSTLNEEGTEYIVNAWETSNYPSSGQTVVFILKMSSEGEIIWFKKFGDGPALQFGGNARGRAIAVDSTGSLYATGYYNSRNNFLTGEFLTASAKDLAYIVKLNTLDGASTYFTSIGSTELDGSPGADGRDITLDFSNGINHPVVYMAGKFTGTENFNFSGLLIDNNFLNAADGELFVVKLDLTPGNISNSWGVNFSEFDLNRKLKLAVDGSGNAFVSHENDIHKINSLGTYEWFKRVNFTNIKDIAISSDGVVHTVGTFSNTLANFRAVLNSTPYYCQIGDGNDVFIRRMDTEGTFMWARSLVSRVGEDVTSLLLDESGFYLHGTYSDSVDFNLGADTTFLFRTPYCNPSYVARYANCENLIDTVPLFACGPTTYVGVAMNNTGQFYVPRNYYAPCDTIEIVNFTRGANSVGSLTATGCSPYMLNGQAFTSSGTFTQVIPNVAGCDSTITLNLTILNTPSTSLSILPNDTICSGQQISAMASGANSYTWNLNNSTSASNSFNFLPQSVAYDTAIVVTGTTGQCSVSDTIQVHIKPLPDVSISGDTAICFGESTNITAAGADDYLWSNNSIGSSTELSPSVTASYNVIGTTNGCSQTMTFDVVVTNYPNLIITPDTSICQGQSIDLEISGASTYQWDNDLGTSSIVSVSPISTTTYSVIGNTNDCLSEAQVTVTYNDQAGPELVVSPDATICQSESTEISVSGADSYTWSQGLGNEAAYVVSPNSTTTYSVVGGSNGCYTEAIIEVTVLSNPVPTITVTGNELSTESFASYQWYFNGEILTSANTQSISGTTDGIYSVEVTSVNGCSNISDEYSFTYISIDEIENSISSIYPNPSNDVIKISSTTDFNKIELFNELGQIVVIVESIETKEYSLELPKESGTYLLKIYKKEGIQNMKVLRN